MIPDIMPVTVETGALTAITALVDVALFLGFPVSWLSLCDYNRTQILGSEHRCKLTPSSLTQFLIFYRNFIPDFPLPGLYTCSILAMYVQLLYHKRVTQDFAV
jgi:hypothetical protein